MTRSAKSPKKRQRILIVDDEPQIRESITDLLSLDFDIIAAGGGQEGVSLATEQNPDLVLLDIIMPGMDGMTACEILRSEPRTKHIPVIMLSAAGNRPNRIQSFTNGADDFVAKPFEFEELLARIRSKLQRARERKSNASKVIAVGNILMDLDSRAVYVAGQDIVIGTLEFEMLKLLLKNANALVTRRDFIEKVWKGKEVPERLIDAHMVSLRKILNQFLGEVVTVYGKGYKLVHQSE